MKIALAQLNYTIGDIAANTAKIIIAVERAKEAGARVYMLVEDATWEHIWNGQYRSQMKPQSLIASMCAWMARYDCHLVFCRPETSGKLIKELLYREGKERMERGD